MRQAQLANNSLIERAARDALREAAGEPELTAGEPELTAADVPFEPALWMILVVPLKPRRKSDGGIEVVDVSQEAEGFQNTVGRVIAAGPAAFEGKTTSGIELSHFTREISTPEQLLGRYVMYQRNVGQELTLRRSGEVVKVLKVTEVLGVTNNPHAWKFYI